jgi:hypothetical protein
MKSLIAALALLGTLTATAQTLQWSITLGASGWATDGNGALAVIHHTGVPVQLGAVSGRASMTVVSPVSERK